MCYVALLHNWNKTAKQLRFSSSTLVLFLSLFGFLCPAVCICSTFTSICSLSSSGPKKGQYQMPILLLLVLLCQQLAVLTWNFEPPVLLLAPTATKAKVSLSVYSSQTAVSSFFSKFNHKSAKIICSNSDGKGTDHLYPQRNSPIHSQAAMNPEWGKK